MTITNIPYELTTIIDSEEVDFIVKAGKNFPAKISVNYFFFGLLWQLIVGVSLRPILKELFQDVTFHFSATSFQEVIAILKTNISLELLIIFVFFLSIGLGALGYGMYLYFQKGGYFVGTSTRLIQYRKGNITMTDWEQFSGNIAIKNNGTLGYIALELRTGKMRSRGGESSSKRYVPDVIYITAIENVVNIENKCRKRIKENDPTPVVSGRYS